MPCGCKESRQRRGRVEQQEELMVKIAVCKTAEGRYLVCPEQPCCQQSHCHACCPWVLHHTQSRRRMRWCLPYNLVACCDVCTSLPIPTGCTCPQTAVLCCCDVVLYHATIPGLAPYTGPPQQLPRFFSSQQEEEQQLQAACRRILVSMGHSSCWCCVVPTGACQTGCL